jgi:hypothetical protein
MYMLIYGYIQVLDGSELDKGLDDYFKD